MMATTLCTTPPARRTGSLDARDTQSDAVLAEDVLKILLSGRSTACGRCEDGRMTAQLTARVLVVEDAEPIRTAVGIALTEAGHTVLTRPDGEGLERDLAEYEPDLVLLDVMLPG